MHSASLESPSLSLVLLFCLLAVTFANFSGAHPVPAPKQVALNDGKLELESIQVQFAPGLDKEANRLEGLLRQHGISVSPGGTPVMLELANPEIPPGTSPYWSEIEKQAYRLEISDAGINITGPTPQAVHYGLLTLDQFLSNSALPHGEIKDWPDLPLRMIMVDPARQNENQDYYRRVIEFAGRYKINAILCHLTDDQTSALYHEDYPELMHHRAWRPDEVRSLVELAGEYYIDLIPEIESLGHSRMFVRREDYQDFLHQTESDTPDESWMGTDLPGYTNVLCPASDKAILYMKEMYRLSAELYPHAWIHIGFDEVDMTRCARCIAAFGEQSPDEWMANALNQAIDLVEERGRRAALWGDMLLSHRGVVDHLSPERAIIFDWYYRPDVAADSALFFKEKGFEVVASPALVCAPHMIIPNRRNYDNIARFTAIAREHDLLGVNTTIWVPTRYMSDVLWTGIAFAAAHAWDGESFDEQAFFRGFTSDYFATGEGDAYRRVWNRIADVIWHRPEFNTACWIDQQSLAAARTMAEQRREEIEGMIKEVADIRAQLSRIGETVKAHRREWLVTEQSVEIIQYSMEHLLASLEIDDNPSLVAELDDTCRRLMAYIEADWDRNRFVDDPGKDGRFLQIQHLFYRFRQMHAFHQELLKDADR